MTLADLATLPVDLVLLAPELAAVAHARIAAATFGAAQALGLGTIAGGIATDAEAVRLSELGGVTGHGPRYGGPVPAEAIGARLASRA